MFNSSCHPRVLQIMVHNFLMGRGDHFCPRTSILRSGPTDRPTDLHYLWTSSPPNAFGRRGEKNWWKTWQELLALWENVAKKRTLKILFLLVRPCPSALNLIAKISGSIKAGGNTSQWNENRGTTIISFLFLRSLRYQYLLSLGFENLLTRILSEILTWVSSLSLSLCLIGRPGRTTYLSRHS